MSHNLGKLKQNYLHDKIPRQVSDKVKFLVIWLNQLLICCIYLYVYIDIYCTLCTSLFIQQPQHHPTTPPFALHPAPHTITLDASASANTRRLSGIKKIASREKKRKNGEGGEKEKKLSKEKIRLWWSTTFSKLARFLAEGQGRETMQRCVDPGIYRRSLEHWAIGRRVGGGGG